MSQQLSYKDKISKKAVGTVRKLARGNSGVKESVQLIQNSYTDASCEAITHIELSHKITTEKQKGIIENGEPIHDPTQISELTEKAKDKFLKNADTRKALSNLLLERPDKGFALHGHSFDLPHFNQQYYFVQACPGCEGGKSNRCNRCNGTRQEQCGQCHGRTQTNCHACRGAGTMTGQDGKPKSCHQCYGKAVISCPLCRARGVVACRICKGNGSLKCTDCDGVGAHTHLTKITYTIKTSFEMDRAQLSDVVLKMVENNGAAMIQKKHITLDAEQIQHEDGGLAIQYNFQFPYSDCTINVNGKPIKVAIMGFNAKIMKMTNFIDQMVEKNYALLIRAGNNDGNIISHIHKSSKSRLIRNGLILAATMPRKQAMATLKSKFPYGASNQIIKDIILQSKRSLSNIAKKNQYGGIGAGIALSAICMALYFLLGGRGAITQMFSLNHISLIMADFLWLPLSILITLALSKKLAQSPLKKVLAPIMKPKQLERFKPRTDNNYIPIIAGNIVVFIGVLLLSKLMDIPPHWLAL